jgi:hypothetical protein
MTTKTTKAVNRESTDGERDRGIMRNWIVTIGPGNLIVFRLKGCRARYETTVGACASLALRQWANAERARKLAARKAKKAAW